MPLLPQPNYIFQRGFSEVAVQIGQPKSPGEAKVQKLLTDPNADLILELLADDVIKATAIYHTAAETLLDPDFRKRGEASDLAKMRMAVTLPSKGLPVEPDIYEWLLHKILTLKDKGMNSLHEILLGHLKEARDKYLKAAEGWVKSDEAEMGRRILKYPGAPELREQAKTA